jgi:hypothetical protein
MYRNYEVSFEKGKQKKNKEKMLLTEQNWI